MNSNDSSDRRRDGRDFSNRDGSNRPYNRKSYGSSEHYNRDDKPRRDRNDRSGGHERDDRRGGYDRNDRSGGYQGDDRRGGYGRGRDEQRGGYQRDDSERRPRRDYDDRSRGQSDQRGGYRRDDRGHGGYQRDDRRGGYDRNDRSGGYQRDDRRGGYGRGRDEQRGGYQRDDSERRPRRDSDDRRPNYRGNDRNDRNDRSGGYQRDDRRGGYDRNDRSGGYQRDDRRGGYGRGRDEQRGGYQRDDSERRPRRDYDDRSRGQSDQRGGYRRDDRGHGGYQRDDRRGGYDRGRGDRQGGFRREDRDAKPEVINTAGDPELSDDITADMLDPAMRQHLMTLSKENSDIVARHLVVAGALLDDEPERAHEHALAAQRHGGRVGIVREALAMTAYRVGAYKLAIREIQAFRRLTGTSAHQVIEADCERGIGRPERALDIIAGVDRTRLTDEFRVELALVESGARADVGEHEAGLLIVEDELSQSYAPELMARLESVRADRLTELGRDDEAEKARARAVELDPYVLGGGEPAGEEVDEQVTIVEDEG